MAENTQTAVAWEMLSSVVVLRAKARENKLPKLLSSLHGVEVELARIIAGTDASASRASEPGLGARNGLAPAAALALDGMTDVEGMELAPAVISRPRTGRRSQAAAPNDSRLRSYCKRYRALARQLRDLVRRGESAATGGFGEHEYGDDLESMSDPLLSEQHEISLSISRLKATTFEGLVDKASVLDDLAEENSDDPVQVLARSLSRDIMAMGKMA
jgi:hypothetical protein